MSINKIDDSAHYNDLVARQVDQYRDTEIMHDLPPIYDYWSDKYLAHKTTEVTGYSGTIEFYAENFRKSLNQSPGKYLISVGSGDCSIEIAIVEYLLAHNEKDFSFVCLELSPILIEKGRKKIVEKGIGTYISVHEIDINKWKPAFTFAGVMAHHSLHHILDLEHLFNLIKENLAPQGRFISCDIIGRNGHMRWPECLHLIRAFWQKIPRKYRYNHQFRRYDDYFENWDCATEGFEGIRAQDILPLLVKTFSFETFLGYGNLIDLFIDRGFGPNFDPANPLDTAFIDYVQELNESLISQGLLKPTFMTAVMVNEPVAAPNVYNQLTPQFAVRYPDSTAPQFDVDPLLKGIPYQVTDEDDPLKVNQVGYYNMGTKLFFTNGQTFSPSAASGIKFLKNGWTTPEPDFTWSMCEEAAIILPLKNQVEEDVRLIVEFMAYCSTAYPITNVEVIVNGSTMKTLTYENVTNIKDVLDIVLPRQLLKQGKIEITFILPNRRQPQFEEGDDLRALGIALSSITATLTSPKIETTRTFFSKVLNLIRKI